MAVRLLRLIARRAWARLVLPCAVVFSGVTGCGRLPDAVDPVTDAAGAWAAHDRCEASRLRLADCPRGTGARKRRRADCTMSERIARLHDPGYPRCRAPEEPRPPAP